MLIELETSPWETLSKAVLDGLKAGRPLLPCQWQEVASMAATAAEKAKNRPSSADIRGIAKDLVSKYPASLQELSSTLGSCSAWLARKIETRVENRRGGCKRLSEVLAVGKLKK